MATLPDVRAFMSREFRFRFGRAEIGGHPLDRVQFHFLAGELCSGKGFCFSDQQV
jgi:hypothetical protein